MYQPNQSPIGGIYARGCGRKVLVGRGLGTAGWAGQGISPLVVTT